MVEHSAGPVTGIAMHRQLVITWMMLLGVGAFGSSSIAAGERTAAERHFFETRIRPVFVQHCYGCHAVDADELAAGLRLDDLSLIHI